MKVLVSPQTERGHAVGAYRLWWPAEALRADGHDVTLLPRQPHAPDARDFDVLVLQRPRTQTEFASIRALQACGVAVVVDIDDDLHALHPANAARFPSVLDSPEYGPGWVAKCCRTADLVTVSTPALAERYAPHGRCVVLPNCVPTRYLDVAVKRRRGLTIGWAGSLNVHPDDLQVTGGGVARAVRDTGAKFHVVGTGKGVRDVLGLDEEPSNTGWVGLADYPAKVARLDIGIVPLAPSRFNEAKSWLKGLEMAALGVPFVASPTGPYRQLHALGAGVLAARPDDWHAAIRRLVRHPQARDDVTGHGRDVARALTIEGNAWRWADAWAQAVENRRKERAA